MTSDLHLRRKWTLRAHGRQVVFVKRPVEKTTHVLLKAFLWALHLPEYPELSVEIDVGDRYRPDVVALDERGTPVFWGEAGEVSADKIRALARRYRGTHFAIAKWNARLEPHRLIIAKALEGLTRSAPVDLYSLPSDSAERFIDEDGRIAVERGDVEWVRFGEGVGG